MFQPLMAGLGNQEVHPPKDFVPILNIGKVHHIRPQTREDQAIADS
jgi:hypothetical protein